MSKQEESTEYKEKKRIKLKKVVRSTSKLLVGKKPDKGHLKGQQYKQATLVKLMFGIMSIGLIVEIILELLK